MKNFKRALCLMGIIVFVFFSSGCTTKESESTISDQTEDLKSFGTIDGTDFAENEISEDIFTEYDLTLVNVWATFCNPCLNEMPDLNEIHEEYSKAGKSFQVVGICSDTVTLEGVNENILNTAEEIEKTLALTYLNIVPGEALRSETLKGLSVVPTTFFVDGNGHIVETVIGARSKEDWIEIIDDLLK